MTHVIDRLSSVEMITFDATIQGDPGKVWIPNPLNLELIKNGKSLICILPIEQRKGNVWQMCVQFLGAKKCARR